MAEYGEVASYGYAADEVERGRIVDRLTAARLRCEMSARAEEREALERRTREIEAELAAHDAEHPRAED